MFLSAFSSLLIMDHLITSLKLKLKLQCCGLEHNKFLCIIWSHLFGQNYAEILANPGSTKTTMGYFRVLGFDVFYSKLHMLPSKFAPTKKTTRNHGLQHPRPSSHHFSYSFLGRDHLKFSTLKYLTFILEDKYVGKEEVLL